MSGNVIEKSKPILKKDYQSLLKTLKSYLPDELEIYPYGSAGKKEISGDVDFFIDADVLLKLFPPKISTSTTTDLRYSKSLLQQLFIMNGLESRMGGNSVYVGIPLNNDTVQVDLTAIQNPAKIAYLHDHVYDNPDVKGKTIVSIWCDLANLTSDNLMISPYKGLLKRDTRQLITIDPTEIAKIIIGPEASEYDMRSPSRLLKAVEYNPIKHKHILDTYTI